MADRYKIIRYRTEEHDDIKQMLKQSKRLLEEACEMLESKEMSERNNGYRHEDDWDWDNAPSYRRRYGRYMY